MKYSKKTLAAMLAVVSLFSTTSVFAADTANEVPQIQAMSVQAQKNFAMIPFELQENILADEKLQEAAIYAYMDIETAPEALESTILQAREEIIFSESWTVNGQGYTVRADGTVEYDPEFSYLFPNWDIPKDEDYVAFDGSKLQLGFDFLAATFSSLDVNNYMIPKATRKNAKTMKSVRANTDETLVTKITALKPSSCNIGYSHAGYSIRYKQNLRVGDICYIFPEKGSRYAIRTSTNGTSGLGSFSIMY